MSLKALAWVSGIYDLALAVPMLFAARETARLFGAPDPVPLLNAQLNGVFTLSLGVGYFWAAAATARSGAVTSGWPGCSRRGWGPRSSWSTISCAARRTSFLLFAATDGSLALLTLALLLRRP